MESSPKRGKKNKIFETKPPGKSFLSYLQIPHGRRFCKKLRLRRLDAGVQMMHHWEYFLANKGFGLTENSAVFVR